jgi:hypothetical protein
MLFPLDFLHDGKAPRAIVHHDPVRLSGGALGRYGLLLLALCLITISAPAAEHYVRAGATGDGSGVDWANAYTELPATPQRGDTYYVAAGSYPGCDIETPASGTSPIIIRKATAWDHGSAPGWNPAWADGVALWDSIYIATNYVIFDGVTGRGRHNHGFEVYCDPSVGRLVELAGAAHDVTLRHLHLHYPSRNWDGRADAFYSDSPCSNIVISDCYVHDVPGCPLLMRNWTGLLFERNWVVRNRSTSVNHAEGVSTHGGGNFIFRDNLCRISRGRP